VGAPEPGRAARMSAAGVSAALSILRAYAGIRIAGTC
jgi:hypothetical protein